MWLRRLKDKIIGPRNALSAWDYLNRRYWQ